MDSIVCAHRDAAKVGRACEHLLLNKAGAEYYPSPEHLRHFTGCGLEFVLLCPQCGERSDRGEPFWRTICDSCVKELGCGKRLGDSGAPQILTRDSGLRLAHQIVPLAAKAVQAAEPLSRPGDDSWLILSEDHELLEFDASKPSLCAVTTISQLGLPTDQPVSIAVSRDGRFVAVTQIHGPDGVVFDRVNRRATMRLARGDYYPEHCRFPVAFFEQEGRQLLIHATDWNRLDLSDPADGALLSRREPTSYRQGEARPAHDLDYFHCGLAVSPDGHWIANNGWIWHPVGVVTSWNLQRWLKDNVWESEDGESKKSLCWRGYFWDGPLCWIDHRTIAVWGLGEDDVLLVPGVRLFDVESGAEKSSFAGPVADSSALLMKGRSEDPTLSQRAGTLAFDRWLFSWLPSGPFSVWDVHDGARLLLDPGFAPLNYHPGSRQFISQLPDGSFRLTRIE